MLKIFSFLLLLISCSTYSQSKTLNVNNQKFRIETRIEDNEWNTQDTIKKLYRLKDGKKVLHFYTYKDNGGDCNNLFWLKETMAIQGDSLIFTTHYFQKTGIDPIPEWRKQIYIVEDDGVLSPVYDRYKYYDSSEWVEE